MESALQYTRKQVSGLISKPEAIAGRKQIQSVRQQLTSIAEVYNYNISAGKSLFWDKKGISKMALTA
jgi:hypothetical protein